MLLRSTLLLCGAIAATALPVWADKISSADVENKSPGVENPIKPAHHPDLNLNALLVSAFPASSTQEVVLIDSFELNDASATEQLNQAIPANVTRRSGLQVDASRNAESLPDFTPQLSSGVVLTNGFFGWGGWWFSEPQNRFFRSLPSTVQPASVSHVDTQKPESSILRVGQTWRRGGRGGRENFSDRNPTNNGLQPDAAVMSEGGSLSLLLLGLAAVGLLGRQRDELLIAA